VEHTSESEIGQIFVPFVNRGLFIACVSLVVAFGSSTKLAAAYGIAVVLTMIMTTSLFAVFARQRLGWSLPLVVGLTLVFLSAEGVFFAANATKIPQGGWFPLVLGAFLFTLMLTWFDGREVVHERVFLVTVEHESVPHVPREEQIEAVTELEHGFWRVKLQFGFMDDPNVPRALALLKKHKIPWDLEDCTFFLGRETVLPTRIPGMALWREHVFAYLVNNAQRATTYYSLPPALVVEFGTQVEI
jgi:KUP system potassium uptake protein